MSFRHVLQLLVPIGGAAVVAIAVIVTRPTVQHQADGMAARLVEVITVEPVPFSPQVTAYGKVEPAITLNSTAEVSGKISYLHPQLRSGSTIPADTVVLRIDTEDYDVSLKQAQADLAANQASLRELDAEEASTQRALELARQNLEVGKAEYARIQEVYERKVVTRSTLDAEEQKVISLQQSVEDVQGRLDGFDSRRQSINSQIARAEQAVRNAEALLARTEISLPFDARVGAVDVDVGEFVAAGAPLFEAVDLNGVEISAQVSLASMRRLVGHLGAGDLDRSVAARDRFIQSSGRINDTLQLKARVRLVNGLPGAAWDARVLRISDSIDATRQTVGIVVGVEDPYSQVIPGERPPLIKGMYTAVDVIAPAQPFLVVPRRAVHQGRVYVADADERLEIRSIDVKFVQEDVVVLDGGLEPGERVIVTDVIPVIEGMPLEVAPDGGYQAEVRRRAAGNGARR